MAVQVDITLTALNGDISPRHRFLNLNPENRTIQVGRASKSLSKGLLGAADNAWFDSPVMSRNHAEISLSAETNTVTLKDIGSMHGTFLNNRQLPPQEAQTFNDGDNVVFGAEVSRGTESFPAVGFIIHYGTSPWKSSTANTFAFPESSDVEDEQECSDDDIYGVEEVDGHSGAESISMGSSPLKVSVAAEPIDLTRDDSEIIEATTKPVNNDTSTQHLVNNHTALDVIDIDNEEESRDQNVTVITDESDCGDTNSIIESDYSAEEAESEGAGSDRDPSEPGFYSENEDDIDPKIHDDIDDIDDIEEINVTSSYQNLHQIPDVMSSVSYRHSSEVELSSIRTRIEESGNLLDENENQSDIGLSDAGAAGIRALFEETFENKDRSESSVGQGLSDVNDHMEDVEVDAPTSDAPIDLIELDEPSKHVAFSNQYITFPGLPSATELDISTSSDSVPPIANAQAQGNSIHRRPSPSDAAMVKAASQPINVLDNPVNEVKVYRLPTENWRKVTAQSLGEKTGKHAFFEARESNRAKIQAGDSALSITSPIVNHPIGGREEGRLGRPKKQPIPPFLPVKPWNTKIQRPKVGDSVTFDALGTGTSTPRFDFSCKPQPKSTTFLNRPSQSTTIQRAASPELDMTSAAAYNENKAALVAARGINQSGPTQPVRRVSIHDIIESSSADQRPQNLKRKADDISGVIEKEIQEWASSTPSADISRQPEMGVFVRKTSKFLPGADYKSRRQEQAPTSVAQTDSLPPEINSAAVPNSLEERPRKRLRKVMEKVAYAALGGAAASVGIFSILVATAPEYL